jgi:hypothetical protein
MMAGPRAFGYTGVGARDSSARRRAEARTHMASKPTKVNRTLVMKIRLPAPEAINSLSMMMKSASPFYKAFGDAKVRLLRNVDSPSDVLQIVEYQAEPAVELNRQKLASDPMVRNFLQGWRAMFPGGIEMDVYEDVGERA